MGALICFEQEANLDEFVVGQGTVIDAASGDPLANDCDLNIFATVAGGDDDNQYYQRDCTDADGGYSIIGLPARRYGLAAVWRR